MKDTPVLKIKLRLNTVKHDKVKKKHRKSKNKKSNKDNDNNSSNIIKLPLKQPHNNGKSFYWTAERIETTKLVLRSVIVTN